MTRTAMILSTFTLLGTALPSAASEPPATFSTGEQVERLMEMSDRLRDMAEAMSDQVGKHVPNVRSGDVRRLIENPDALRDAAREMQDALEESNMLESLAEMAIMLSEQVDVVEGEDSLSLSLQGREVLSLDAKDEDRITLKAGGKRITIESD